MTAGRVLDDHQGLVLAPTQHVLAHANPLTWEPWGIGHITATDVLQAPPHARCDHDPCRDCHLARIHHFVTEGINPDDPHPILIDVGFGDYWPAWPILDGNHRLAAAAITHPTHVPVTIQGDWNRGLNILLAGHQE